MPSALPSHPVLQRRGDRLGDDPDHVEAGDLARLAGGVLLQQAEVRRDGDHHVGHLAPGVLLGLLGQRLEDESGDRRRGVLAPKNVRR